MLCVVANYGTAVQTHPTEPPGPSMKTDCPGPESLRLMKELDAIQVICLLKKKK